MNHDPQASVSRIRIDFAQASDPGRDPNKQVNEDSCGYAETRFGHLAVLCDGMGGHYGGKEASRTAITTIFEVFEQMPLSVPPAQALKSAIEEAGRRVYLLGGPPENRTRPGSTVVAMLLSDRGLDVAHVGDSRAYIIRSNQIYPLTRDHSMVQGMIDAGMLTEETAMGHPDSNKITRALGMRPDVDVELRPEVMELFAGDILLQSSDGLTDLALGRDILGATRQALASGGVEHACNMLVKMANDRGGHDNITVQMVRVAEMGPKVQTTIPEQPAAAAPPSTGIPFALATTAKALNAPQATAAVTMGETPNPPARPDGARQGQAGWSPVMPTAPDGTPPPVAYGAPSGGPLASTPGPGPYGPTLAEAPPSKPWTSGQFQPLPQQQAARESARPQAGPGGGGAPTASLAAYRMDEAAGLPLPPPSRANTAAMSAYGGTPTPGPAGTSALTPQPGGFAPPSAMGGPAPYPGAAVPSRGGVVFVILGLSAVIAVLVLVVIWALWLR